MKFKDIKKKIEEKKMNNQEIEEEEKLWKEFCMENKGHINIGTKKDVIFWTYDKLLLNQIEARKEILELNNRLKEKDKEILDAIDNFKNREKSFSCSCDTVPKEHICHFCFNIEELKKELK